jgi:hypothetical protein
VQARGHVRSPRPRPCRRAQSRRRSGQSPGRGHTRRGVDMFRRGWLTKGQQVDDGAGHGKRLSCTPLRQQIPNVWPEVANPARRSTRCNAGGFSLTPIASIRNWLRRRAIKGDALVVGEHGLTIHRRHFPVGEHSDRILPTSVPRTTPVRPRAPAAPRLAVSHHSGASRM